MDPTQKPFDEPSDVTADGGAVHLVGPDGVDVMLTPEAAEETSERILHGAMKARGQTYLASNKRPK